jgi:acetyl-CoA synthetase
MGHSAPGWKIVVLKHEENAPAGIGEQGRVAIDLGESPLAWFTGYGGDSARSAEKFSPDGRWYFTGDTGHADDDGYLYFSARDDDVIIMAGYRIGPVDVESVLSTHPAVAECAVVAVPDEIRGEVLEAVVVLRDGYGSSESLTSELQERVKRQYAAHAYPRHIHYAASLPRTPSGKVQRYVLRQQLRVCQPHRQGSECV